MTNEEKLYRSLTPLNISNIAESLKADRLRFLNAVEKTVDETIIFSQAAANTIGGISYIEAQEGVIDYFMAQMRINCR